MTASIPCAIAIEGIKFRYPKAKTLALNNVNFSVNKGEIFGLLGPNGGGKSTLFKLLSTAVIPSEGTIRLNGKNPFMPNGGLRHELGVIFQSPSLDSKLTVMENLVYQSLLYGLTGSSMQQRIQELLKRFKLLEKTNEYAGTLSGGLQRRVEIIKALLHDPQIILMDEPSTGLDPLARIDLWNVIKELKESGKTILLTTHLMEEAERCDQLAIMHQGELVAKGSPQTLKEEVGGDVLTLTAREPETLRQKIESDLGLKVSIVDFAVRIETQQGESDIPRLMAVCGSEILTLTLSKPTLEDVFIRRTGHKFS